MDMVEMKEALLTWVNARTETHNVKVRKKRKKMLLFSLFSSLLFSSLLFSSLLLCSHQVEDFTRSWVDGSAFAALMSGLHADYKFCSECNKAPGTHTHTHTHTHVLNVIKNE